MEPFAANPALTTPEVYLDYLEARPEQQLALTYHQNTVLGPFAHRLPKSPSPGELAQVANHYKIYNGAPRLVLPANHFDLNGQSLAQALKDRRSTTKYRPGGFDLAQVGQLLFAANGISGQNEPFLTRTAPSGGTLYPIEIYLAAFNPADFEAGLYHYAVRDHALELLKPGDFREAIAASCWGYEDLIRSTEVVFFMTAIFSRTLNKYGARGYRYILLEAGHIGQNFNLAASALGLGALCLCSFVERKIERLFDLDGQEEGLVYAVATGHKA
jgi:SagB-type dehydrogenase family enzyme